MEEGKKVVDTPVNADLEHAISSNWAYDHAADIGAHTKNPWQVFRTGEYCNFSTGRHSVTKAVTANTLYAIPIFISRTLTVDAIAIQVETLSAAAAVRLGIYADGTNLYPGALVLDCSTVSVATTGIKSATINQQLTKGIYWLALVSNGNPNISSTHPTLFPLGYSATDFTPTGQQQGWSVAFSYAALPTPFPSGGALLGSADRYNILLKLLTLD